jgi:hypothetical protein
LARPTEKKFLWKAKRKYQTNENEGVKNENRSNRTRNRRYGNKSSESRVAK